MAWGNVYLGDYGWIGQITVTDSAGVAEDISSFTTRTLVLIPPNQVKKSFALTFDTDGTDGVLTYTFADGDIHIDGAWTAFARLLKSGTRITTDPFSFTVLPKP